MHARAARLMISLRGDRHPRPSLYHLGASRSIGGAWESGQEQGDRHWVARCPGPGCDPALNLLPVQEDLLNRHAGQVREQDVDSLKIAGPE